MRNTLFTLSGLILAGAIAPSSAAAQSSPADTARFARHHLGLTASPVLDNFFVNNRNLPLGMLYKHSTGANRATRYGVTFQHRFNSTVDDIYTKYGASTANYAIDLYIGREYSRALTQRWTGVAGGDLGVGFARSVFEATAYGGTMPSTRNDIWYRGNHYSAQLRPFVALRFYVMPRLYLSAETCFQVYYGQSETRRKAVLSNADTGEQIGLAGTESQTDRNWSSQFQLIRQLTLHYTVR